MYEIVKSFAGSQDGRFTEEFVAGTRAELTDYLASCAPPGAIRLVVSASVDNKAIVSDGSNRRQRRNKHPNALV